MLKPQFLLTHKIPLTIYRRSLGSYVDGEWIEGATTEVPVEVNIQPLKGYEILQLPESERTRVWWKLYSALMYFVQRKRILTMRMNLFGKVIVTRS